MNFFKIIFTFFFVIIQNIIITSSVFATNYTVTLANKSSECSTLCNTSIGTGTITAGSNIFTFSVTDKTGIMFVVGMEGNKQYTLTGVAGSIANADAISGCVNLCQTYKNDAGFNLSGFDAPANLSKNKLTKVMCNALNIVMGSAGKTFASFAVIATGIGFFTGKVSWGLMIGVAAGIATMFGAPSIVAAISGDDSKLMCNLQ